MKTARPRSLATLHRLSSTLPRPHSQPQRTFATRRKRRAMDYTSWSNDALIRRVTELERQLKEQNTLLAPSIPTPPTPQPFKKKHKKDRPFDPKDIGLFEDKSWPDMVSVRCDCKHTSPRHKMRYSMLQKESALIFTTVGDGGKQGQ